MILLSYVDYFRLFILILMIKQFFDYKYLKYLPYIVFAIVVFWYSSFINLQEPNEIWSLVIRSMDEEAFQHSIQRMWDGWMSFDPVKSVSFGFYAYGWIFWLIPGILWFPFYLIWDEAALIFIPRLVAVFFAFLSVVFIYKILRLKNSQNISFFLAIFLFLIPWFWENAFWFHPDHMMVSFAIISLYFLIKDEIKFERNFWIWVFFCGVALAAKLTVIMFTPVFALYITYWLYLKKIGFKQWIIKWFLTLFVVLAVYILLNPYVLHPRWFSAVKNQFLVDMKSNKSAHGKDATAITHISIYQNTIERYYMHYLILILWLCIWMYFAIREFKNKDDKPISILVVFWIILSLVYLTTMVSKEWQHYYLFPFMFFPLIFANISIIKDKRVLYSILAWILIWQWITQIPNIVLSHSYYSNILWEQENQEKLRISDNVVKVLKNQTIKTLSIHADMGINYNKLWVKQKQVQKIYWRFNAEHIVWNMVNIYFKVPDFIILNKKSPLFDIKNDKKYKNWSVYDDIINARKFYWEVVVWKKFIVKWDEFVYKVFSDDEWFVILKKDIVEKN